MSELVFTDAEGGEDEKELMESLKAYNRSVAGDSRYRPLTITQRASNGDLLGGMNGKTSWGWLYVNMLWVREDQRGTGLGAKLLAAAESEAKRRGCIGSHLLTASFQAPGFYEKQGYSRFGELKDFPPPDHSNYFYYKRWK